MASCAWPPAFRAPRLLANPEDRCGQKTSLTGCKAGVAARRFPIPPDSGVPTECTPVSHAGRIRSCHARPAGELAFAAGVTAQTASSHLSKLLDGGLLSVEKEGRHRYYRLADPHVALVLEGLAAISTNRAVRRKPLGREAETLRFARCCYDHLAGRAGVAVTQRLIALGYLAVAPVRLTSVSFHMIGFPRHQRSEAARTGRRARWRR